MLLEHHITTIALDLLTYLYSILHFLFQFFGCWRYSKLFLAGIVSQACFVHNYLTFFLKIEFYIVVTTLALIRIHFVVSS